MDFGFVAHSSSWAQINSIQKPYRRLGILSPPGPPPLRFRQNCVPKSMEIRAPPPALDFRTAVCNRPDSRGRVLDQSLEVLRHLPGPQPLLVSGSALPTNTSIRHDIRSCWLLLGSWLYDTQNGDTILRMEIRLQTVSN
jgi:hypothetical protein